MSKFDNYGGNGYQVSGNDNYGSVPDSYQNTGYAQSFEKGTSLLADRGAFIVKTYLHLLGAVLAFVVIEAIIISLFGTQLLEMYSENAQIFTFVLLGVMIAGPFVANFIINSSKSIAGHYLALALYVSMYVLFFVPILTMVLYFVPEGSLIVGKAGILTGVIFAFLTAAVFITRKDFSFLRSFLIFGSLAALGLIVVALIFQFQLGLIFTYAMIALMCMYILYDTSNVLLHYHEDQYVLGAIELFASVMTLFMYILRLLLAFSRND